MKNMSMEAKRQILEEIMSLMDEKMGESMKGMSPKFAKPEMEAMPEESEAMDEEKPSMPEEMHSSSESEDEDEERLRKMYEDLK